MRDRAATRALATAALAALLLTGCDPAKLAADPRDVAWAGRVANDCPAIAGVVRDAWTDGLFSIEDLERVEGALKVAHDSPVKGQRRAPRYLEPTSTRDVTVDDGPVLVPTTTVVPDGRGGTSIVITQQLQERSHVVLATE